MLYSLSARSQKKENKILPKGYYKLLKFLTLVSLTARSSKGNYVNFISHPNSIHYEWFDISRKTKHQQKVILICCDRKWSRLCSTFDA